ncbi:KaiC-like protein 2 [Gammaproteobacteria bacterium]
MKNLETLDIRAPTKIPTGIEGFEHLSMGGLPQGRTTLLVGTSGSGKTIFGVEFLYRGITQHGHAGIFVTLEEKPIEIMRNVKRVGWDLMELIKRNKLAFVDGSPDPIPAEEVGHYNLEGLIFQIRQAITQINADFVVIDSIGSLFHQFSDTSKVRLEIFRITEVMRELGVTTLMTAERLDEYGHISRHGVEEFISDNVIVVRNVLLEEKCRRTIQVLKMRGDVHCKGEYPFTITNTGITILALSAMELTQESSNDRTGTGNSDLDLMTNGGIFRDSIFLVSGPTGGGKTLMSAMFAAEGCRSGEKVLLLAYEESREQLLRNASSWGINFFKWEQEGLLRIVCQYPEAMGLEDHLLVIRREILGFKPRRLIMDSISAMERVASVRNFREFVIGLTSFMKQERVCSLFTSTTPQLSGGESVTETHISTITDVIALLRYVEINGILRRGIAVIKMRGSQHDKRIREFTIDGDGMHVGEPFQNVQNIMLGVASVTPIRDSDRFDKMFE